MKKIFTLSKPSAFFIAFLCAISFGFGQVVAWEFNGNNGEEVTVNATTINANLNMSTLSRGGGINPTTLNDAFSSNDFTLNGTQANALTNNDYLQFQVSTQTGYQVSLSTLDVTLRRSNTGSNAYIWRYSTDGVNFNNIGTPISYTVNAGNGTAQAQINLSAIAALQNVQFGTTITFRLYAWGATNVGGTFAIGRLAGNDLSIGGVVSVAPPCPTTTTWNGATWNNGLPALNKHVVLNGNYFTNATNVSFSACSLTVNNGFILTINDNYYVEVENNIAVAGEINVRPRGAVKQNSNAGTVTTSGSGIISVTKSTAILNNWYEYTYWSSPVSGETIGSGLSESDVDRRFRFNASNYLDALREINNNNTFVAGQDDVDDNGDDWTLVNGATVMQPGVGYAATHDEAGFFFAASYDYTFRGPFNNGIINVNVVRNDTETNDNNWNLIGNPYPSAISADSFFSQNSYALNPASGMLDGTIYLWSQNTAPSDSTNGNEGLNFSASDYATINGAAQTAGGDGLTPVRFIPSGQAFFVSVSDSPASPSGNVVFNNSMRVVASNTQFFRNSNTTSDNKLWVNLTSDNGVFNQIAIAYIDGATNGFDGTFYDAPRNLSANLPSSIYTSIEGNTKKFVIQGKASNSLTLDEVIPLGFNTSINVPTVYTLSIAQFEGDFMTNNPIYLKDNLLNTIHNLSTSAYNFTSQVGEFESRFEIVFQPETLSIGENDLNANSLTIIELNNDNVKFTVSNNFDIKSVAILDLLGRTLYQFEGQSNSEVYNLSNLSNTVYIAKVELSSGQVITKRAIKRN